MLPIESSALAIGETSRAPYHEQRLGIRLRWYWSAPVTYLAKVQLNADWRSTD
jgi:hypothetical protein